MKIADIRIGNRVRIDLGDIERLAMSIGDVGLLQPVWDGTDWQEERR